MPEINKSNLLWVLELITKLAGETSIITECGGDFDARECNIKNCKHYDECVRQKTRYAETSVIIEKIHRL